MRRSAWGAALVASALAAGACSSAANTSAASRHSDATTSTTSVPVDRRPYAFTVRHETFVDPARPTGTPGSPGYSPRRELPTDIYLPTATTPRPLIMFSHGYDGSPRKFSQLLAAWARAGYAVAAPRFPLTSNESVTKSAADLVHQPGDISFVLTKLLTGPLRSKIDATRIAAAGLSLGGATTYNLVENACCRDPRFRAAAVFDAMRVPIHGTFTKNTVPLLIAHIDTDLAIPYATAKQAYADSAAPKFLLTFHTGIHGEPYENTPSPHDATATKTSIDFFDLTLLGDASARARLVHDGTNPGESQIVAG